MTQKKTEAPEDKPIGLYLSLNSALSVANWITSTDIAAITLARRLALLLDTSFDIGETKDIPALTAKYLAVLQDLHLTVNTRIASKQGEENDGTNYVGQYLRLIEAKDTKPKPKAANSRASS